MRLVNCRWNYPGVSVAAYMTFLVWPNHFSLVTSYFLMWWAGAIAAHLYLQGDMRLRWAAPEVAGLVALTTVAGLGVVVYGSLGVGYFPILILRHCATVLAMFLILFTPVRRWLASISFRVAGPAAAVAGISYGLYVVHYPLLVQTDLNKTFWILAAVPLVVALAWVADKWAPSLLPKAPKN